MFSKLKEFYKKYKEIINYMIFGTLTAVVNLVVKYILLFTICDPTNGFELQTAIVISWIAAVIFAYITNRKYVFFSKNEKWLKELIGFVGGRLATLLIEMFVMWFFVTNLKLNTDTQVVLFTIVSQILVIIGNYIVSKLFVFKKENA